MVMRFYPFKEVTSRVAVLDEIPAAATPTEEATEKNAASWQCSPVSDRL